MRDENVKCCRLSSIPAHTTVSHTGCPAGQELVASSCLPVCPTGQVRLADTTCGEHSNAHDFEVGLLFGTEILSFEKYSAKRILCSYIYHAQRYVVVGRDTGYVVVRAWLAATLIKWGSELDYCF